MEENQDNLKNLAAKENKEISNAIVDENTKEIIDVEELLQGQDPVASKLNNLMKIGVSIEQIKSIYELSGGTQPGITLDAALEELNKVFYILARGINESPNALMVDLITGAIDFEATRQKEIELGDVDEYITSSYVMKEKDEFLLADALNMMLGKDKIEQTMMIAEMEKDFYSDFLFNMKDLSMDLSDQEIGEIAEKLHTDKNELARLMNSARKKIQDGAILSHTENNVHEAIAKYMRYVSDKRPHNQREKCLEEVKNAILACPEEERKKFEKYLNEDGTIDATTLVEDEKKFMKLRNQGAVDVRFMAFITGEADFSSMDNHAKEKLLISLARSLKYEDVDMQKLGRIISENIGIEYSYKGIRELLNTIVDRNLQTDDQMIALAQRGELNPDTAEVKYDEIRSNLNELIGKDESVILKERVTAKAIQEYDRREKVTLLAIQRIGTQLNKSGHDFRGYEIAMIYMQLHYQDKNSPEAIAVKKYIENNFKFFEDFFGDKENLSVFNNDGELSIIRLEKAVKGIILEPENYDNIKYMMQGIEGSKKSFESNKNALIMEKIREIKQRDKVYLNDDTRAEIIALTKELNYVVLSKEHIEELITMDPIITDAVVTRKQYVDNRIEWNKITHSLRLDNKTKDDALRDTAILLEARINAAKGTALYGKLTKERDDFYENNPDALKYRDEIRDDNGNITDKGQEMIDEYLEGYRRKKISNHLKDIVTKEVDTPEEKQNIAKWLIVALKNGNHKVRQEAIQKMKKIFPQYDTNETEVSKETMIENLFFEAYGKRFDKKEQEKIEQQLTENFTKLILKESIIITDKTLTDDNFHDFFDTHAEGFDATLTNLSVSEFQNYFEDSEIKYEAEDDKNLAKLYAQSTINSWISSKETSDRVSFLALKMIQEESSFKRFKTITDEGIEKYMEDHKEGSEEWLQEDGSIDPDYKLEAKLYVDNKMTSEILKGFSRNVFKDNKTFNSMSKEEREGVLEQILVALGHINSTHDPLARKVLTKLTYRAAEMLNTEDRQVLKFGKDKKMYIDEEVFIKLCNKNNSRLLAGPTDLGVRIAETYDAYKKGFFLEKAEAYSEKGKDEFYELQSKSYEEKLMEIEQLKVREREKDQKNNVVHSDKVRYETRSQANVRRMLGTKPKKYRLKSNGNFKLEIGNRTKAKTDYYIDDEGVKVFVPESKLVFETDTKRIYKLRGYSEKNSEEKTGLVFEEMDTSAIDESVKTTDNIEEPSVVVMQEPRPDETQQQKSEEVLNRFEESESQNEDYEVEVDDEKENKGIRAFFKKAWERITNKRLGTGQEENKKQGFFAKIFNRKEKDDDTVIVPETTSKQSVPATQSFHDYIKVENSNSSIEQGAMDASSKGVDGIKNMTGKGQATVEEVSQE